MTALLVVLTVVEIVLVLVVLVVYLLLIRASLARTAKTLARVSFGVRAIEQQVDAVAPEATRVNGALGSLATILPRLADRAGQRDPS